MADLQLIGFLFQHGDEHRLMECSPAWTEDDTRWVSRARTVSDEHRTQLFDRDLVYIRSVDTDVTILTDESFWYAGPDIITALTDYVDLDNWHQLDDGSRWTVGTSEDFTMFTRTASKQVRRDLLTACRDQYAIADGTAERLYNLYRGLAVTDDREAVVTRGVYCHLTGRSDQLEFLTRQATLFNGFSSKKAYLRAVHATASVRQPAEYIERESDVWSYYCPECVTELGVDLAERDGALDACTNCGHPDLMWELWNGVMPDSTTDKDGNAALDEFRAHAALNAAHDDCAAADCRNERVTGSELCMKHDEEGEHPDVGEYCLICGSIELG